MPQSPYSPTDLIAWATLTATIQLLRSLAERGVIAKADVEHFGNSITAILENGPDGVSVVPSELSARIGGQIAPILADIHRRAPDA